MYSLAEKKISVIDDTALLNKPMKYVRVEHF